MSMTYAENEAHVVSGISDGQALPLGAGIGDAEYADLMYRIGLDGGELGTPISAFNSSI